MAMCIRPVVGSVMDVILPLHMAAKPFILHEVNQVGAGQIFRGRLQISGIVVYEHHGAEWSAAIAEIAGPFGPELVTSGNVKP